MVNFTYCECLTSQVLPMTYFAISQSIPRLLFHYLMDSTWSCLAGLLLIESLRQHLETDYQSIAWLQFVHVHCLLVSRVEILYCVEVWQLAFGLVLRSAPTVED